MFIAAELIMPSALGQAAQTAGLPWTRGDVESVSDSVRSVALQKSFVECERSIEFYKNQCQADSGQFSTDPCGSQACFHTQSPVLAWTCSAVAEVYCR